MVIMNKVALLLLVSIFGCTALTAQQKIVADKIAGIVGDKIILRSEIKNAIDDIVRQGGQAPDQCMVIDRMLIQKAMVMQAERDSIPVTDEEVEAAMDQKIRYYIAQYGGKDILEQIAGRSVYQLKEDMRQPIREEKLAAGMQNKIVEDVKITPTEVKEYFERIPKDSLPFYESKLQIGTIVTYPKASRDIELLVIEQLNQFKREVEAGRKKFDALAKFYSDDPGSKEKGGEYQLSRGDKQWDKDFMAAAFRLKEGQISPVIKTSFGYHIIQMVSRNGDDAVIRHILRIPEITQPEIDAAVSKLDSIRDRLVAGHLSFGEAVDKYSEEPNAHFTAGMQMDRDGSTYMSIDKLDKEIVLLLKNQTLNPGEFSKPTPFTDERGKKGVQIIYLKSKSQPHRENLNDDYDIISQHALEVKKQAAMEKWFTAKIPTFFIMIDKEFKNCSNLSKWQSMVNTASN